MLAEYMQKGTMNISRSSIERRTYDSCCSRGVALARQERLQQRKPSEVRVHSVRRGGALSKRGKSESKRRFAVNAIKDRENFSDFSGMLLSRYN